MLLTKLYPKEGESLLRTIDYSDRLQDGETIDTVVSRVTPVTTPALVVVAQVLSGTQVSILVSDGLVEETYMVEIETTTTMTLPNIGNTGQTRIDCIEVVVREVCAA